MSGGLSEPRAFFLPVEPGARCCIYHAPAPRHDRGCGLVYVHPFGEEMNKARRMAALQSRRLAAAGFSVLQMDLYGCGDSSGDFVDARWDGWARDLKAAVHWLKALQPSVGLWGLRLGATLAADVAQDPSVETDHLLLWQPVANGAQFLSQFLRLRLASEMLASGAATTALGQLRAKLAAGNSLEIAGYELHPELASALERLDLAAMLPAARRVHWLEVDPAPAPALRPASNRGLAAWRARGVEASALTVAGEPFWSTLEIAECEALLAATDQAMGDLR